MNACKKDSNSGPAQSAQVKTYTEDVTFGSSHDFNTFNLSYDSEGRLSNMESATTPGSKFVYAYPNNSKFTMDIYNNYLPEIHTDLYLDVQGKPDSSFQFDNTNDTSSEKFIYNGTNLLVTLKDYSFQGSSGSILDHVTNYEYDSFGNVIKETGPDGTTTHEYYTDQENTLMKIYPYTLASPNLVKTDTRDLGGGIIITLNHTYTFDDQKRITSDKALDSDNGITIVKTYGY